MSRERSCLAVIMCMTAASVVTHAQTPNQTAPPHALTLDGAIEYASEHYPTLRAALEQVNASAAGVDVARSAYLPRLDSLWQSNRATANNIFGQLLPQSVIPSMSGPVCHRHPLKASGAAPPARSFRGSRLISGCVMPRSRAPRRRSPRRARAKR